jgi:hypothetical protein
MVGAGKDPSTGAYGGDRRHRDLEGMRTPLSPRRALGLAGALVALAIASPVASAAEAPQIIGGPGPGITAPPGPVGMWNSSATVGTTIELADGTWSGSPTITRHLLRCDASGSGCSDLGDPGSTTYTLGTADAGHRMFYSVTATNDAGSTTYPGSVLWVTVAPQLLAQPTFSNAPSVGSVLVADPGQWLSFPPDPLWLDWQRCDAFGLSCVDVGGHFTLYYAVSAADIGHVIELQVSETNFLGGAHAQVFSGIVPPLSGDTTPIAPPPVDPLRLGYPSLIGESLSTLSVPHAPW